MDDRLLRFAELLFRSDTAAVAATRAALADPAGFVARHAADLGYVRPEPGWSPEPWPLLLDLAQFHGWVWRVDWREAADEVAAAVGGLAPAGPLAVDWAGLAAAHSEADTLAFLEVLARAVAPAGEALVCLDCGSDSYPLALLRAGSLAEAGRLAAAVGGRVDALDAEPGAAADPPRAAGG